MKRVLVLLGLLVTVMCCGERCETFYFESYSYVKLLADLRSYYKFMLQLCASVRFYAVKSNNMFSLENDVM